MILVVHGVEGTLFFLDVVIALEADRVPHITWLHFLLWPFLLPRIVYRSGFVLLNALSRDRWAIIMEPFCRHSAHQSHVLLGDFLSTCHSRKSENSCCRGWLLAGARVRHLFWLVLCSFLNKSITDLRRIMWGEDERGGIFWCHMWLVGFELQFRKFFVDWLLK